MLRWNQILRELVARYNLPPAPRDNGTYVFPDANNPFADPAFPFANPPYAARAYSYVAVAQFEALKVAWSYKYQYNRPSPSQGRQRHPGLDADDRPARLSVGGRRALRRVHGDAEAAVPGGRSRRSRARPASSGKPRSCRAGPRRATSPPGSRWEGPWPPCSSPAPARTAWAPPSARPAQWQALANAATGARGDPLDEPRDSRRVRPCSRTSARCTAWMMTPDRRRERAPGPPPSTSSAQMQQELAEVKQTVDNLTREQLAIAYKWNDGAGTYTPPGPLERHRGGVRPRRPLQRGARGPGLRPAEHGHARRRRGVLGGEVRLLQPAPLAAGSEHQDGDRPSELPGLHLGTLDLLGGRGRRPLVPVPERRRRVSTP